MNAKSTKRTGTRTTTKGTLAKTQAKAAKRTAKIAAKHEAIRKAATPAIGGVSMEQKVATAAGEALAGKPAAKDNILLRVEPGQFADALNKATVEQLEDALKLDCWSAKNGRRIEAALACRKQTPEAIADGQKAAAENIAKTVAVVETGDLAKGVEVPMPAGRRAAKGRDGAARGASGPTSSTKNATDAAGRNTGQRGATGAKGGRKAGGKMSGLDAATKVLAESAGPLNAKQIVEAMAAKGYWSSNAATPHATIYAGIIIEIAKKSDQARFKKTDRGLFTVTAAGKQAK